MAASGPKSFRTKAGDANIVECLVAFMDLLGVQAMTKLAPMEELAELRSLDTTMRDVLTIGQRTNFRTSTFSDSIAIAMPLPKDETAQADALRRLLLRCADLQLALSREGFFLRGGLTIGRYFHDDHMVYGAGLVEAWKLEDKKAITPRILIDRDCEQIRTIVNRRSFTRQRSELLTQDHDGSVFLDYLASARTFSKLADDPDFDPFQAHKEVIEERLRLHRSDAATWAKYRWVAEYHNAAVATQFSEGKARKMMIEDGAGTKRRFSLVRRLESGE